MRANRPSFRQPTIPADGLGHNGYADWALPDFIPQMGIMAGRTSQRVSYSKGKSGKRSSRRTAQSVVDTILGEASSPREYAHIASVIANRMDQTGMTAQQVVAQGLGRQFNAYGKSLPKGVDTAANRAKAQAAIDAALAGERVTSATYFAMPGTTQNLPRAATASGPVAHVKGGHMYFDGPFGNRKQQPMPQIADLVPDNIAPDLGAKAAANVGGFMNQGMAEVGKFAQPNPSMVASRPEYPGLNTLGLLGKVDVADTPAGIMAAEKANGMFQPGDPTVTVAQTEKGIRDAERQAGMYQPSTPQQTAMASPNPARFGPPDMPNPERFGPQDLGGLMADNVTTAKTDRLAQAAPGVTVGQDNPRMARELDRQMMAGLQASGAQAETPMPPDPAEEQFAMNAFADEPAAAAGQEAIAGLLGKDLTGGMATGAPKATATALNGAPPLSPPQQVADYPVAAQPAITPPADAFPPAPEEMGIMDKLRYDPKYDSAKRGLKGLLTGGLPGAAVSVLGGLLADRLGPGFDAAVPESDRFSTGSGLGGIMDAMNGERGATGTSLSNPGMSYTSLGDGTGLRHSGRFGWTEVVGPDGSVRGINYAPGQGGILGSISRAVGGLLGGDRPTQADRDKFSGRVGLY